MKKSGFYILVLAITLGLPMWAGAYWVSVTQSNDPIQDAWTISNWVDEVGIGFPTGQVIGVEQVTWGGHTSCPSEFGGSAVQLSITNLTTNAWTDVYYVANTNTTISNYDEWIAQVGFPGYGRAFLIDSNGVNTPLVYESMAYDGIWQIGEVWQFVIQDYWNAAGGSPAAIDSLGVAAGSSGGSPSTGSIVVIPEPGTLVLVGLGSLFLLRLVRRRAG